MASTKIDIRTKDGILDATEYRPDGAGPFPAVIFFMDAGGIRPTMHQMAERLSSNGFRVLLPNLYYRAGAFAPFNAHTMFADPAERERLMKLMGETVSSDVMGDVGACLDYLGEKRVGTVGYCMGGMLAFRAAAAHPDRIAAVAAIHAGRVATDDPTSPHLGAPKIKARLYFGAADNDRSFTPEQRAMLENALRAANVRHDVEIYTGAMHGFAVPDFPVFNHDAAEKHWQRVVALFNETLR